LKQRIGGQLIIYAIKESEKPTLFVVSPIVPIIDDSDNSPNYLTILVNDEWLALSIIVERMRPKSHQLLLIHAQGRNPVRIVFVEPPN
jgi:hypothetical protein